MQIFRLAIMILFEVSSNMRINLKTLQIIRKMQKIDFFQG